MNLDRTYAPSMTLLGGGLIFAILASIGLLPEQEPQPASDDPGIAVSSATYPVVDGAVSIESSMWDDPFIHMDDAGNEQQNRPSGVEALVGNRLDKDGHVMVLVVPVREGNTPEDVESRRRRRHAVELALANQGFELSFPDRMTYRKVKYPFHLATRKTDTDPKLTKYIECQLPTKLYQHKGDGDVEGETALPKLIVLTWIQESHLGKRPLDTLRHITSDVLPTDLAARASFCLLGPNFSDTLKDIVSDAEAIAGFPDPEADTQVTSTVTSEDSDADEDAENDAGSDADKGMDCSVAIECMCQELTRLLGREPVVEPKIPEESPEQAAHLTRQFFNAFECGVVFCNFACTVRDEVTGLKNGQTSLSIGKDIGLKLIHTIGSDDQLLSALRRELSLRGALPNTESLTEVVIFAEQGSLSYINDLQKLIADTDDNKLAIVIPYLKGIGSDSNSGRDDAPRSGVLTSSVEDYLNRSMSEVTTLSSSRGIHPSRVRAVGIIGSEWADKALILKKARNVFPVATFFTTELDARYNLPGVLPYSRNLLVASHYGLAINGREKYFARVNNIPSFRDGYQTSAFIGASVLSLAFRTNKLKEPAFPLVCDNQTQDLYDLVGRSSTGAADSQTYLEPLTFEIGLRGPVQLDNTTNAACLPIRQPPTVNSILAHWPWIWMALILIAGLLLFLNFLSAFSHDLDSFRRKLRTITTDANSFVWHFLKGDRSTAGTSGGWPVVFGVLLILSVVIIMVVADRFEQAEPLSFTNGVSLWPSIWGLALVMVFSVSKIAGMNPFPAGKGAPAGGEGKNADEKNADKKNADKNKDGLSPMPDLDAFAAGIDRPDLIGALKLSATVIFVFYLTSYIDSGFIQPPARVWLVRWLANGISFLATLCLLMVTFHALLSCLYARKAISEEEKFVKIRPRLPEELARLVHDTRCTMHLSINSSRGLFRPAILSLLLIAARWDHWDAWGLDRSGYMLLAVPIFFSFIAAIVVRVTAVGYRDRVIEVLRQRRYELLRSNLADGRVPPSVDNQVALLEESQEEIERLRDGPFGPLSRDNLLGAGVVVLTVVATGPASIFLNHLVTYLP